MLVLKFLCFLPWIQTNSKKIEYSLDKSRKKEENSILFGLMIAMHSPEKDHFKLIESIVVQPDEEYQENGK